MLPSCRIEVLGEYGRCTPTGWLCARVTASTAKQRGGSWEIGVGVGVYVHFKADSIHMKRTGLSGDTWAAWLKSIPATPPRPRPRLPDPNQPSHKSVFATVLTATVPLSQTCHTQPPTVVFRWHFKAPEVPYRQNRLRCVTAEMGCTTLPPQKPPSSNSHRTQSASKRSILMDASV